MTKFSQCSNAINTKIIQVRLGLRPFTMCIALAMAFAHKYQCFQYKITSMHLGHIWPSNMYKQWLWPFGFQNNVFSYSIYLLLCVTFYKVYRPIWSLKHVSGHRPCPIACSAFKSVLIITNFSILLSKHFN